MQLKKYEKLRFKVESVKKSFHSLTLLTAFASPVFPFRFATNVWHLIFHIRLYEV